MRGGSLDVKVKVIVYSEGQIRRRLTTRPFSVEFAFCSEAKVNSLSLALVGIRKHYSLFSVHEG